MENYIRNEKLLPTWFRYLPIKDLDIRFVERSYISLYFNHYGDEIDVYGHFPDVTIKWKNTMMGSLRLMLRFENFEANKVNLQFVKMIYFSGNYPYSHDLEMSYLKRSDELSKGLFSKVFKNLYLKFNPIQEPAPEQAPESPNLPLPPKLA